MPTAREAAVRVPGGISRVQRETESTAIVNRWWGQEKAGGWGARGAHGAVTVIAGPGYCSRSWGANGRAEGH